MLIDGVMGVFQTGGYLEFMIVAQNEFNLQDRQRMLIDHLKELERTRGGWSLGVDLTALSLSGRQGEIKAHYQWIPHDEEFIELERGRPVPGPDGTFESLGLDVDANPDLVNDYFELLKRYEDPKWRFTVEDLGEVGPGLDEMQNPAVRFEFKAGRKGDFMRFTKVHVNRRLAMVLDGRIITAPVINSAIPGSGIISGPQPRGFTLEEQKELLMLLDSGGYLKMNLELISMKPGDDDGEG
jgi:hypothetical protein